MKKITSVVLAALLIACTVFTFAAFAEDEGRVITVTLDGNPITFDVPPQLIEGRTMVPLRMIFEALGAEVSWDDATQTASGVKGDTTVKITINEKVLYKNGQAITLDVPAQLINDRTLVPVRAISESFEVKVDWDDATSTVILESPKTVEKKHVEKKHVELKKDAFVAGNGYHIISDDGEKIADNSPVTVTDIEIVTGTSLIIGVADGKPIYQESNTKQNAVQVSHGGYYQDGKNWGGVALKDAYKLDGLSVTVKFDEVPKVDSGKDCWICIDFLNKPQLFQVGDVPGNPGFMNLIRFGKPGLELYDGMTKFQGLTGLEYDSSMFAIKSGDVVTVSAKLDGDYYAFTFANGDKTYTYKYESSDFTKIFTDGKAHVAVSASCKGSQKDAFKYTITDISYVD